MCRLLLIRIRCRLLMFPLLPFVVSTAYIGPRCSIRCIRLSFSCPIVRLVRLVARRITRFRRQLPKLSLRVEYAAYFRLLLVHILVVHHIVGPSHLGFGLLVLLVITEVQYRPRFRIRLGTRRRGIRLVPRHHSYLSCYYQKPPFHGHLPP